LLTTDLLSEGVNLHNAQVVVHLDIPWTVARLEQRVGRLSRIGSPHESVHVFGFAPPRALELAQRTLTRLRLKWRASRRRFGESALLLDEAIVKSRGAKGNRSHAEAAEELRRLFVDWLGSARSDSPGPHAAAIVAYVKCVDLSHPIALALLRTPSGPALLALDGAHEMTTHPDVVLRVAQHLSRGKDATSEHGTVAVAVQRVRRYLARRRGEEAAGADVAGAANGALLARIAQSITRLPRSRRPDAVRQAASLRALIGNARSAGDHALLAEKAGRLLEIEASDPMRWLDIARSEMASFDYRSLMLDRGAQSWGLDAILIGT
jgi:hypothetical protein